MQIASCLPVIGSIMGVKSLIRPDEKKWTEQFCEGAVGNVSTVAITVTLAALRVISWSSAAYVSAVCVPQAIAHLYCMSVTLQGRR
jgi:hypothetical protein